MGNDNKTLMPKITIDEGCLKEMGFTKTGISQLQKTTEEIFYQLFNKSVAFGNIDKNDSDVEITHDHVKSATRKVFAVYGDTKTPKWIIVCQVFEYIFSVAVGVSINNLNENWGILTLAFSCTLFLILFITRLFKTRNY